MTHQLERIGFDEFVGDVKRVFDLVSRQGEPVLVERDGESFLLAKQPTQDIWANYDPEKAKQAFRQAAGILQGVDTKVLVADIYSQRDQDSIGRPH